MVALGRADRFPARLGRKVHHEKLVAIYVMQRDGTHLHRVTQKGASVTVDSRWEDHAPAWSPNGRRLAFERFDRKRDRQAVFTMHRDGTSLRRITPWWLGASSLTTHRTAIGSSYAPMSRQTPPETSYSLLARGFSDTKSHTTPPVPRNGSPLRFLPTARRSRPVALPSLAVNSNRGLTSGQCGWMAPTCTTSRRHPANGKAHPTGGPGRNHTIPGCRQPAGANSAGVNSLKARPLRRAFVECSFTPPLRCRRRVSTARGSIRRVRRARRPRRPRCCRL